MVETIRIARPRLGPIPLSRTMARASAFTAAGLALVSVTLVDADSGPVDPTIRLGFIASASQAFVPTVALADQNVSLPRMAAGSRTFAPSVTQDEEPSTTVALSRIESTAVLHAPTIQRGAVSVALPIIATGSRTYAPTVTPGAVEVRPGFVESASRVFAPSIQAGAVGAQLGFIPSSSVSFEPTITAESSAPWYEADPQFERMSFIMDASGQRAAIWTGEGYGSTGMIPKREATFAECFLITAAAGRSYVPLEGLPYLTDTAENAPLFDGTNGRWQFTTDPVPRFNRLYPSAHWTQAQTLQLLQWDYVISGYFPIGSGIAFDGASITGGHFELLGQGESIKVWGRIPHPDAGDVLITPIGEGGRFVNLDTHGNGGYDPDYPTQWIPTTTERVDRPGDDIRFTEAVRTMLINPEGTYQGTIVVQGQFFGPARVAGEGSAANRRIAIGWDNISHIGVDVDGNAVCNTGAGVPLSTPLGSGGNGDPFRLVLSFRDRDDVGGFRDGYDGIRRLAGNGGPVAEHTGKYNGGTGWITRLQFARTPFTFAAENCGAGRYDLVMISPDLMSIDDVGALARSI